MVFFSVAKISYAMIVDREEISVRKSIRIKN